MDQLDQPRTHELLAALGEQLAARDARFDLVVIGGSGLLALGLINRPTRDVEGFVDRLERRDYGDALTVHFASRFDQIHFKLYAMVDQGVGKHEADLRALEPTAEELVAAARWAQTHDPSDGFRTELRAVLSHLGVDDATLDA